MNLIAGSVGRPPASEHRGSAACEHCGLPVPAGSSGGATFCCSGCAAANALVRGLGLDAYYRRRILNPDQRPLKPDDDPVTSDPTPYVRADGNGTWSLSLMVDGLHCAACVWLIESVLGRQPGIRSARVNMTTRRLTLSFAGNPEDATHLLEPVSRLGYRLVPFDPHLLGATAATRERELLRAMAVAGFAAGNVMLLSVAIWAGHGQGMGPATRELLHWISALIALPAIVYAGRPFFRSALTALRAGRSNMDVPISIGVILTSLMSLHETVRGADHAYFDSAIGLLFFLLIGRLLDRRVRGIALTSAEHLLALSARPVVVIGNDDGRRSVPPQQVQVGMRVLAAAGERIGVDGLVLTGVSEVDTSLIDGETLPKPVRPGSSVFAGTLNLVSPLVVEATAVGENTLLSEIARLMETAEAQKGRYVALADRVARRYAPVVHSAALFTFFGWWLGAGAPWQESLMNAIAVLIITCPCALALAVPATQVVAIGQLLRRGILVKSGTALERLSQVGMIVFDKTGTLTEGRPELIDADRIDPADLGLAAGLAAASRHPLARAVVRAAEARGVPVTVAAEVHEVAGQGLELEGPDGWVRLGSRKFCGVAGDLALATDNGNQPAGPELFLAQWPLPPVHLRFADRPRQDAATVITALKADGYLVAIMSGDREPTVAAMAAALGVGDYRSALRPEDKVRHLEALKCNDNVVLMVGDGLNDAPALAAAHVSMSPTTAADISQTAADVVFQGERLAPVRATLLVARRARRVTIENLAFALVYNLFTIPLAVAGQVTPLIAAVAMSSSSLVVILNALRLRRLPNR